MNTTQRLLGKHARKRYAYLFRKCFGLRRRYSSISLTAGDVEQGLHKECLGGGAKQWDARGLFQLSFLKERGLLAESTCLDIGCGPIRGGMHLIGFLDAGNYCGVDYNSDFIRAAHKIAEQTGITKKSPSFRVIDDFSFGELDREFDYAIVFSVLNHCSQEQRNRFFEMMPGALLEGGKVYISHARWFDESVLEGTGLRLTNQFDHPDLDLVHNGWVGREGDDVVPIVELTKS